MDGLYFGGSQFLLSGAAIGDPNSISIDLRTIVVTNPAHATDWFTTRNAADQFVPLHPRDALSTNFLFGFNSLPVEVRVTTNGSTVFAGYRIADLTVANSSAVPEPSSLTLLGIGLLSLCRIRSRRGRMSRRAG